MKYHDIAIIIDADVIIKSKSFIDELINYQFKSGLINELIDSDTNIKTFEWLKSNGQDFHDNTMCVAVYNRCKFKSSIL